MKQDPRAIGAHIRMRLPQLTPLERKVVDSMTSKNDLSEQTSLKEVALENAVSEAMIVKLAKKLDFSGFREFRTSLIYYNNSDVASLHSEIGPNDSSEELLEKVFRTSIQAIEETKTILDISEFNRAADILFKARHIDLYGVGGSSSVARDLSHKLLKIGIKAMVHDDAHMMMMSAAILSDDDVVIAISHSGMTRTVIDPIRLAAKNGAKVIAITNYAGSALAKDAHIVLNSTSQGSHLLGENAAARIAQLNILDALFVAIAKKDLKKAALNLNKTQQAVKNLREY
ncbi:RpiR family transcriptional regulator [Rouxiella silvae]|uniref:RpiR family transcriptional regulator n=1 Tax=Rouxiella silvae TaxID=1646373 RepID=A0AA41BW09_9GAMM|nr:MurR/RpiR family transcriptional regulator [Rouxiella silvae]KQN44374.1 RpiR family transcriptional regulator [Serratia sp. Leaf50]MBF6636073.1 MurR/RpiR family transcriptional regulator [Rouxiella silvae]ORJ19825.1 RpiR family transcriptional regulator [Rouxiella silvae]